MTYDDAVIYTAFQTSFDSKNKDRGVEFDEAPGRIKEVRVEDPEPVTSGEIARLVGCSHETIRRRMQDFKEKGLVEIEKIDDRKNGYTPTGNKEAVKHYIIKQQ